MKKTIFIIIILLSALILGCSTTETAESKAQTKERIEKLLESYQNQEMTEEQKKKQEYLSFLDKLKPVEKDLIRAAWDNNAVYIEEVIRGNSKVNYDKQTIDRNFNINVTDINGRTPLMICATYGHEESAKVLLKFKANVNAKSKGEYKTTALIIASTNRHIGIVSLLLAYKANVNIKDSYGMTAYDWAKTNANLSMNSYDGNVSSSSTTIMYMLQAAGAKTK